MNHLLRSLLVNLSREIGSLEGIFGTGPVASCYFLFEPLYQTFQFMQSTDDEMHAYQSLVQS